MNVRCVSAALLCLLLAACSSSRFGDKFDYAFSRTLSNEGGYVNDPGDPGGETNYGISRRAYPDVDIRGLTVDKAKYLYYRDYWCKSRFDRVRDCEVAAKLFDISVNFGDDQAREIVQRSLMSVYRNAHLFNGDCGWDKMIPLINCVPSNEAFLAAIRSDQAAVYRMIVHNKEPMRKFLRGWLNRAYT
jgi:lysozyme family protein